MRKRYITIPAVNVQTGDRFTIGNVTYYVSLVGAGVHPNTQRAYNMIGAYPESNKLDYVVIELAEHATFTILKK